MESYQDNARQEAIKNVSAAYTFWQATNARRLFSELVGSPEVAADASPALTLLESVLRELQNDPSVDVQAQLSRVQQYLNRE